MAIMTTSRLLLLSAILLPTLLLAQAPDEIGKLREQIAAQQKQLDEQRKALEAAQQTLERQEKLLEQLASAPAAPTQPAPGAATAPAAGTAQVDNKGRAFSPLAFHIGGADFTPGGFVDFPTVLRSTNLGTGIATSFGSIPFSNTAAGRLTEIRSSAQNSRLSLKVTESPTRNVTLTGYVEADFWGTQPTGGYVTSNSNTLRMRQYWVNVQKGRWEVLGGQGWTLLTPNRVGVSSVPADLFLGLEADANYLVGLTWARQGQLRLVFHPDKKWSIAASIENPEQFVTTATTVPAFASSQVSNGSATSTPNVAPDFVAKAAYDTKVGGKAFHVETAGLWRHFRTSPAAGVHFDAQGFGGSFNSSLEIFKNFRFVETAFVSSGGGRYILGLAPDLTVGPDGSISPVHALSGIAGFEYAPDPKSQIYAYYGGDYFRRNYTLVSPGSYLGFGFPGSSNAANRQIQEPSFGYIRTFWKNPNYGALQVVTQYSYLTRAPWWVAAGSPSSAHAHMVFASLRFTLP
jgi:hypothetical protein